MEMRRNIIIHFPSISYLNLNIENMSRHKSRNKWKPFLWCDDCFVGLNLNKNCRICKHQIKPKTSTQYFGTKMKTQWSVLCESFANIRNAECLCKCIEKTFNLFGKSGNKLSMNWIRAITKHSIEKFIFIIFRFDWNYVFPQLKQLLLVFLLSTPIE